MRRADSRSRRHDDVRNKFIRPQIVFAFLLCFGDDKEFFYRDLSRTARADDTHLRVISDQDRSNGGRAHEVSRAIVTENSVVAIVALKDERFAIFLGQQPVSGAEVPAARTLAEIAADGCHVADLGAGSLAGRGSQHGMLMLDL